MMSNVQNVQKQFRDVSRKAETYRDGGWHEMPFQDLKKYDVFRLYEPGGELVVDVYSNKDYHGDVKEEKTSLAVAISDAFLDDKDVLTVNCVPIPEN